MEYLIVLASYIFIIGFMVIFQRIIKTVIQEEVNSATFQKIQSKLFVRVAILEVIPLLILILTFTYISGGNIQLASITIPVALIVFIWIIGILRVVVSFREGLASLNEEEMKRPLQVLLMLSFPLMGAIPIISIVLLILVQG